MHQLDLNNMSKDELIELLVDLEALKNQAEALMLGRIRSDHTAISQGNRERVGVQPAPKASS